MSISRWPAQAPPRALGAIAHGPHLLARGAGIAAGLRCVAAHPDGLVLELVVEARDIWAEAASRQSFDGVEPGSFGDDASPVVGSAPELVVGIDGRVGPADPFDLTSSGGADEFSLEATYWIPALPRDGLLHLTTSWPQAGLEETTTQIRLTGLDDLASGVVTLVS